MLCLQLSFCRFTLGLSQARNALHYLRRQTRLFLVSLAAQLCGNGMGLSSDGKSGFNELPSTRWGKCFPFATQTRLSNEITQPQPKNNVCGFTLFLRRKFSTFHFRPDRCAAPSIKSAFWDKRAWWSKCNEMVRMLKFLKIKVSKTKLLHCYIGVRVFWEREKMYLSTWSLMVGAEKTCFNASMWTCPVLGAVKWKAAFHEKMLKKCIKIIERR